MSSSCPSAITEPDRPYSAPPAASASTSTNAFHAHVPTRPSPLAAHISGHGAIYGRSVSHAEASSSRLRGPNVISGSSKGKGRVLGIQDTLRKEVDGVVKRRVGGVLTRGFILKTDHYPTGRALDLDLTIQGAPNFRAPDEEGLNVYGVAQPTVPGLKAILTILGCQPSTVPLLPTLRNTSNTRVFGALKSTPMGRARSDPTNARNQYGIQDDDQGGEGGQAVWFSTREETLIYCNGRPYVLRDTSDPFRTLALSDRANNLEDIERRLKLDILDEARRYGGMILIHDESPDGDLIPTWMSVDEKSIRTPIEVWDDVKDEGWRVTYWRIPIAPDKPIEDNYLDAYVSVLRKVDPLTTSLVFNCGMGVVRTTFAMCAALLVRRKQYLTKGLDDPFPPGQGVSDVLTPASSSQAAYFLQQATQQQALNKSLLRLTRVLERNLPSKHPSSAIDLLAGQPTLLEQLRRAHMGDYQIVLSLLSSLDNGRSTKRLVDQVIDTCDAVVNLRESVIEHRIKYSLSAMGEKTRRTWLDKALRSLEQYFDLIVFAAYVEEEDAGESGVTFLSWLLRRQEIWNQIKVMRRHGGNRLFAFAPVNDLSMISRSSDFVDVQHIRHHGQPAGRKGEMDVRGGKILGDEWADHVVTNRNGIMLRASTLLKSDLWLSDTAASSEGIRGAVGFRRIPGNRPVYTTGQPTQHAVSIILEAICGNSPKIATVIWVCLREEPLVMINGTPYCLRRDSTALRNMRDYTGVSASRLEVLEERLKSDVIAELGEFQNRLLLHSETVDGEVVPIWESVDKEDVASLREVMDEIKHAAIHVHLNFIRIPVTSESTPDFHDITQLLDLCMRSDLETSAFIFNDQLGRGRSSTTAVIVLLIQRWLCDDHSRARQVSQRRGALSTSGSRQDLSHETSHVPKTSWQIINSSLRVIRNGLKVKQMVDEAIDRTAAHFNLRDTIEDFRIKAEEAADPEEKHNYVKKGIYHLRRYYHLIIFQAYLDERPVDEEHPYSFESFVKHRPVFKTLETELENGGLKGLSPIDRVDPVKGMALPDEVTQLVANRSGSILSAQTILKSDFFLGLQKQSLPERVEGAANYRKVPLDVVDTARGDEDGPPENEHYVYGTGMPSVQGLRNALSKMLAGPQGPRKVMWTSLREEPVLYVKSRPYVLRLLDKPLANVETTGVSAAVVERMEVALKNDVLAEIQADTGRLLLHDECETQPGLFEIVAVWENVEPDEVMTPRELYDLVIKENYHVDYARVAVTDEQAPLPATLQTIVTRVASGIDQDCDFVFNCQMGRGRTTTGMITASLISSVATEDTELGSIHDLDEDYIGSTAAQEASQYLNGEYKAILQLVTVLSHGKQAKRLTDKVIDQMEGVQNLRQAVYDFKVKVDASESGSPKHKTLHHQGINYLYRYGMLIVLANFLLETKEQAIPLNQTDFPAWMQQHREIRSVLSRKTLD